MDCSDCFSSPLCFTILVGLRNNYCNVNPDGKNINLSFRDICITCIRFLPISYSNFKVIKESRTNGKEQKMSSVLKFNS